MTLRPYQSDLADRTLAALQQHRRVLVQLPTGAGKTRLAAHVLRQRHGHTLWLADRLELVQQAQDALQGVPATVATVQSFRRRPPPPAATIVIDEAHGAACATYRAVVNQLPDARIIGLTATPVLFGGRGLSDDFDHLECGPPVSDLIRDGFLVPTKVFGPSEPDLSQVPVRGGEFQHAGVVAAMRSVLVGDIVSTFLRLGRGRAIAFANSVPASIELAEAFRFQSIPAAHLDGSSDRDVRRKTLDDFRAGRLRVIVNADLFGKGLDIPAVETIIQARPTMSLQLHLQQIGRGTRPFDAKPDCIILDHVGNHSRHGFFEDSRQWSRDGVPPAKKSRQTSSVRRCPKCFALSTVESQACWLCGAVPPPSVRKGPRVKPGDLVPLSRADARAATWADKRAWWEGSGGDGGAFRRRFGHLPPTLHGVFLHPTDPAQSAHRRALFGGLSRGIGPDRARFVLRARFGGDFAL